MFEPNTGALKIFNFAIFLKLASDVFITHGQNVIFPKHNNNNNNNNNNNIYTGGFRNGPVKKYYKEVLHTLKKVRYPNSKKLSNAFQFLFKK